MTHDEPMKPMVYKIHYHTKGGINIPDQRMEPYTTKSKTRKWIHRVNKYLLDTSKVANDKVFESTFGFGLILCLALVNTLIEARLKFGGLTGSLEKPIHEMLRKQISKSGTIAPPT